MHPILFKIGPITIYTYGFFLALGILLAYRVGKKRATEVNIERSLFFNLFFWALISGFIGARIAFIVLNWVELKTDPLRMLLDRGGFIFFGGVFLALISLFLFSRKYQIRFLKVTDLFALVLPLGQSLGRIGCFAYGCCYGIPTQSWLGLEFPINSPAGAMETKIIPTQLISAGFLFLLFIFLFKLRNRVRLGKLTGYYLLFYALFRLIIEFFRGDSVGFFLFLPAPQWISLLTIFLAIYILSRSPGNNPK